MLSPPLSHTNMLVHTVPVCPPSKHNAVYTTSTLNTITSDCCAVIGLTNKEFCQDPVIAEMMGTTALPWHCELVIDDKDSEEGLPLSSEGGEEESKMDKCSLDDVIMLQYTSGSTGLYNNNTFRAKQLIRKHFQ